MFLKSLLITSKHKIIREIIFRKGINLIIDETKSGDQSSGNNVGKTTVLKLIDFCLGAKPKIIYSNTENKKESYTLVKNFLIDNNVLITLTLTEDLDNDNAKEIIIERNFLLRKKTIIRINNEKFTEDEFKLELIKHLFPEHQSAKPTIREIISHNIRYKDEHLNQTLKTLNKYTSDAEYETLYLFLLGCKFDKGNERQEILSKLKQEITFKNRLEKHKSKTAYENALFLIEDEIEKLNRKKSNLNINENFENDLDNLNKLKYQINKKSSEISKLNIRKDLILEAKEDLNSTSTQIDLEQLSLIYQQANKHIDNIQKNFNDLVKYHNQMVIEKVKFIVKELPILEQKIKNNNSELKQLLEKEKELSEIIAKSDSFKELEDLIGELNENHRQKGETENIIEQLNEVEQNKNKYEKQLEIIDNELFSGNFENIVKRQINKFNKHFASISNQLYGEKYALNHNIITHKRTNQKIYKFSTFSPFTPNLSSGKKQGEISAFDIAYILFADEENISCLHFLLNDKKELMHDNQLEKIAELIAKNNIQFVASILKDKLPIELNKDEYFIVKLSPEDKLFRIEN